MISFPELKLKPVEQLFKEQEQHAKNTEELRNPMPVVKDLAVYIRKCWDRARMAKEQKINSILIDCKRRRDSKYDPDKETKYKAVGSDIYVSITDLKCGAAESWINDTMNQNGARAWSIVRPSTGPILRRKVVSF